MDKMSRFSWNIVLQPPALLFQWSRTGTLSYETRYLSPCLAYSHPQM